MSSEQQLMEDIKTLLNIDERARAPPIPVTEEDAEKNRVALIGTTGAGKSAVVAGLGMEAQEAVKDTAGSDRPFYVTILEKNSQIYQDMSNLRNGHFPTKTAAYSEFAAEAGLLLEWERWVSGKMPILGFGARKKLWHKAVHIPIIDIAGEDIALLIKNVRDNTKLAYQARVNLTKSLSYIQESDGYIVIIKASRAQGFTKQLEMEKDERLSQDPDVNLVRMLQDLVNYKRKNRVHPVRGIAVIVTAWDKLKPVANEIGFNIASDAMTRFGYTVGQRDIQRFVAGCFPSTYALLMALSRGVNIQFFPMFFLTEKDENGEEIKCGEPGFEGQSMIKRRSINNPRDGEWYQAIRKIYCADKTLSDLLLWLKQFAKAV
jgi:hypothetical protein